MIWGFGLSFYCMCHFPSVHFLHFLAEIMRQWKPWCNVDWCNVSSSGGVFRSVYVICAGSAGEGSTSPTRRKRPCVSSSVPLGLHNSPTEASRESRDAIPAWPDAHFCLRATFSSSHQGRDAEKTWNNREEFEPGVVLLGGEAVWMAVWAWARDTKVRPEQTPAFHSIIPLFLPFCATAMF